MPLVAVDLCGLLANMLFVPTVASLATEDDIASAGSLTAYIVLMGLSVFFEFGITVLGIGAVVLLQDVSSAKNRVGLRNGCSRTGCVCLCSLQSGCQCAAYADLGDRRASRARVCDVVVAPGCIFSCATICVRSWYYGLAHPVHLALTLTLGVLFNNRGPILGIALGSVLGGTLLGGFFKPLLYVTPWILPKVASLTASAQPIPPAMGIAPLVATISWSLVFILVTLAMLRNRRVSVGSIP